MSPILHSPFDGSESSFHDAKPMTILDMSDINNDQRKPNHSFTLFKVQVLFYSVILKKEIDCLNSFSRVFMLQCSKMYQLVNNSMLNNMFENGCL